jgi:hypothetical protein
MPMMQPDRPMRASDMGRIHGLIERWRGSSVIWWMLAVVLGSSARETIWPMYLWLRKDCIALGWPSGYTWAVSAIYFSFWVWLFVLLAREGKRYRSMILDAGCGGSLLTVAAALHDPAVRPALSKVGFGAAAWVTFLSAAVLVVARSAQRHEGQSQQR